MPWPGTATRDRPEWKHPESPWAACNASLHPGRFGPGGLRQRHPPSSFSPTDSGTRLPRLGRSRPYCLHTTTSRPSRESPRADVLNLAELVVAAPVAGGGRTFLTSAGPEEISRGLWEMLHCPIKSRGSERSGGYDIRYKKGVFQRMYLSFTPVSGQPAHPPGRGTWLEPTCTETSGHTNGIRPEAVHPPYVQRTAASDLVSEFRVDGAEPRADQWDTSPGRQDVVSSLPGSSRR